MGVWKLEKWQKKKREEKLWTKNLCTYRTSMFIYLLKHKDSFFISLLFVLLLFDMVKTAQLQHLPACYLCTCISILKLDIKYTIFYYVVKTFFHFLIFLFFFLWIFPCSAFEFMFRSLERHIHLNIHLKLNEPKQNNDYSSSNIIWLIVIWYFPIW